MTGEDVRRELLRVALSCAANEGSATEVSRRESPAGSGLQVPFEAQGLLFCRKLNDDPQRPWTVLGGMSAGTVVVPLQTIADVARHADVVTARVDVAPNDVHEALADASHASTKAIFGPIRTSLILPGSWGRLHCARSSTQFLPSQNSNRVADFAPSGARVRREEAPPRTRLPGRSSLKASEVRFEYGVGVRLRGCAASARQPARARVFAVARQERN